MPQDEFIYVDESGRRVNPPLPSAGSSPSSANFPPIARDNTGKADLLDKIQPDKIVERLRHNLMGEVLVNGEWKKLEALKDVAIEPAGAWQIATLMLPASSQNVSISRLKDEEIRERTLEIVRTAQMMLLKNWKEWGIKGTDQLDFIHQIVMTNTFITLKQPEGGGIRELIKGITQEHRQISEQPKTSRRWQFWRK